MIALNDQLWTNCIDLNNITLKLKKNKDRSWCIEPQKILLVVIIIQFFYLPDLPTKGGHDTSSFYMGSPYAYIWAKYKNCL